MPNRTLDLGYLAQKLDQARSSLLPPHSEGEVHAFANSFAMCAIVPDMLKTVAAGGDTGAARSAQTILDAMNVDGIPADPRGTHFVKIERMSADDRFEYSRAVDTLATWAIIRSWGAAGA